MRLGKPTRSRTWQKAGTKAKPKNVSPESVVGQLSSDIILTVLAPKISEIANGALEEYAAVLLDYEDEVAALRNETTEADIEEDGSISTQDLPSPPTAPLFRSQFAIDELTHAMTETSEHFMAKTGGWRVHANAAKFERMLDEKYGIFRPFITNHPEIELVVRSLQRKYAMGYFSPIRQGAPPIPRSTAVIILVMMVRGNMKWEILVLSFLFLLVGLQPWALVSLVVFLQLWVHQRKYKTVGTMKRRIPAIAPYYARDASVQKDEDDAEARKKHKEALLLQPVGKPLDEHETIDAAAYDAILLGCGPGCLYTAALLSRAGRKVLVLSPKADASGCLTLFASNNPTLPQAYKQIPFDVESSNVTKISRQQQILAPALSTTTDCQGGVRFAQIGCEADGYAFEILSVPGMGTDGKESVPFILRAAGGVKGLMDDAASLLGDGWPAQDGTMGQSSTGAYVEACQTMNATASLFYMSKILPESINKLRTTSTYQERALRDAGNMLNASFPQNPHLRSLMAAVGSKMENLKPSQASMAPFVTNMSSAMSGEGMFYPVGGPRALCHALANVVEQAGGRIVAGAPVVSLVFEERETGASSSPSAEKETGLPPPLCVGVELRNGKKIQFDASRYDGRRDAPVVVAMDGIVHTFVRLVPEETRIKHKVPRGLPALAERRWVVHVVFLLKGSAADLDVTGADYYRLPGAALAFDERDPQTGAIKFGEVGGKSDDADDEQGETTMDEATNQETASVFEPGEKHRKKKRPFKFEPGYSWMRIAFPSAKDPSFEGRHGKLTTCVVTVEADDDFLVPFDTKPKVFQPKKATASTAIEAQRLMDGVQKDLLDIYPQLQGHIAHSELRGPQQIGLSHTPARYAANGVRVDTPYEGLYLGGSDLTVGGSFSGEIVGGWLAANAIAGYGYIDHLFLQKNITSDLERFLQPPSVHADEEDVAVPYTPPAPIKMTLEPETQEHVVEELR